MKKYFKFTFSSFLMMLLLITIFVMLTGNNRTGEKSAYGINSVDSTGANIYINSAKVSFDLPSVMDRYFKDTSFKPAANYLKKNGALFVAEFPDDPYGLEIYTDKSENAPFFFDASMSDSVIESDVYNYLESVYSKDLFEYSYEERVDVDGITFIHFYYVYKNGWDMEYDLVSDYVANIDGEYIDIRMMRYDRKLASIAKYHKDLDSVFEDLIESLSYGKNVKQANAKGSRIEKIFSFNFYLGVFLLLFVFVLISNMTVSTNYGEWHEDALSQKHSKEILGFFSVCIVLHHLVQQVGVANADCLGFLENAGVCFVGMFFFYSGYGLMHSMHSKDNYLKGFFRKRLSSILIPFYLCIMIFVAYSSISGTQYAGNLIENIVGIRLINSHMWYIVEIAILYSIFYLAFKLCKKEKTALIIMAIAIAVMIAMSLMIGHGDGWFQGEWWYNSTFLFFVGILFSKYQGGILPIIRKHYKKVVALLSVAFIVLYQLTIRVLEKKGYWTEYLGKTLKSSYADKIITLLVQLAMITCFVFLIIVIGQKVKCSNAVLRFLGNISLELYLIHNIYIKHFSYMGGVGIYFTVVLLASIITAALIKKLDNRIICAINGRKVSKVSALPVIKEYFTNVFASAKRYIIRMARHPRKVFRLTFRNIICIFLSFLSIYPLYTMAINATQGRPILKQRFVPGSHFIDNLNDINSSFAGAGGNIYRAMFNSCLLATITAVLTVYLASLAAYAFTRYEFKGKKALWRAVILCMMMPASAGLTGMYYMMFQLKLLNRFTPLILMAIANPAAVYLINMYMQNQSFNEIGEAARIDGASEFRIFNTIIIPMIRPIIALQMIFSFSAAWNNGAAQSTLLIDWKKKTITPYISILTGGNAASIDPQSYALAFFGTIPPLIVYILCCRSVISSITLGAVKE